MRGSLFWAIAKMLFLEYIANTATASDAAFNLKGRQEFDCSLGIVGLPDGHLLTAGGSTERGKGYTGHVKLAVPNEKPGLEFVSTQQ